MTTLTYAGFWRRYIALAIDGLILIIPSILLGWILPYVGGVVLALLYKPVFESSPLQGTPGKAMMGLMVTTESGARINFKQGLIRYAVSIISGLVLFIGYLMNLFTAKRQTLHDMVAGTVVIKSEPPDLNYFQVWMDELKAIFNGLPTTTTTANTATMGQTFSAPGSQPYAPAGQTSQATSSNANVSVMTVEQSTQAIEALHKLAQSGAITHEEFESKKQQILSKLV